MLTILPHKIATAESVLRINTALRFHFDKKKAYDGFKYGFRTRTNLSKLSQAQVSKLETFAKKLKDDNTVLECAVANYLAGNKFWIDWDLVQHTRWLGRVQAIDHLIRDDLRKLHEHIDELDMEFNDAFVVAENNDHHVPEVFNAGLSPETLAALQVTLDYVEIQKNTVSDIFATLEDIQNTIVSYAPFVQTFAPIADVPQMILDEFDTPQ